MKKSNPTKLLFIFGCVFTGIALAAFVVFSAIFIKGMDGTNYVLEGIKAILSTFTSLFGGAAKGSVYTYAVIGVGGLATLMTVYFTVLFATAKKGKSIVATLLAFVAVVIICLAGEAFIITYVTKAKIGMRVIGGIFASVMPALLGLVSFLVYDVVSFVDVAAPAPVKKEDTKALEERCDDLQKQIDELKKALEEKADAKEEVVEEVKEEEPAPAVVEEVKEEPAPAPVVEEKEEEVVPDQVTVVDETTGVTYLVRYNKSYTAKLALAKDEVQGWYNEVKNYLLSYGANSRVSWNYDAFNIGRKAVAKLNITGKTLSIYIALEPAEYVDSKYHAKDVSSSKKYEQTPTSMKIKSDRGVKFAKELIDILMASMGQERKEKEAEDFTEAKRTLEELLAEGLVKETKTAMSAPVAAPAEEVKEEAAPAPVEEGEVVEVEAVEEPEEVETEEEAAEEEKADAAKKEKTIYHVSKREGDDGREWKVFKQGSKKVIKLFDTQAEALEYAKTLAKNKDDGSTVLLHGLDGKIRKY